MRTLIICVICGLICVICGSGCVDNFKINMGDIGIIDIVSVNPVRGIASNRVNNKGDVAICIDDEIYITDLTGSKFTRVTENNVYNGAVSWAKEGLLYTEKTDDVWTLNLYKQNEGSEVLLQEMNRIAMPIYREKLGYLVLSKEDEFFGSINMYESDTGRIYTVLDNAYYDYKWLTGQNKIAAISVTNVNEDTFQGVLLIKDVDTLQEEVIFNGTFKAGWDYLDFISDNKIIFSSDSEIYLYNLETKELSKWKGKEGYDYRMPPSINSNLKGYILAKVKGVEEEWKGQLYLVKPDGEFIPIPGWPFWINEPMIICMDLENYDIIVKNLENNETTDLIEKFHELQKDRKSN